jgi:NADPH:quinone reductase-like Zn-dependent oxidoreductase
LAISLGLQGLTADFLAHDLARNEPGSRVLLHGISGGVGQILTQMLVADQIHVDGVASTGAKRQVALQRGARQVFSRDELGNAVLNGQYDTVFDGVGTTLTRSLELVKHRGKVVFYGMAGGRPTPVDPVRLLEVSKSILTGDLWDYLPDQISRQFRFERVLQYVLAGQLQLAEPTVFALADGRRAHEYLENGQSMGKIVLKP